MASGGVLSAVHPEIAVVTAPRVRWWRQTRLLVLLLGVLNIADLVTTRLVLDRGGSEGNPVMAPLVEGMWAAALLKLGCVALIAVLAQRCLGSVRVRWGLLIVCSWYAAVVSWNLVVLAQA
jgi:hypothetical protein